jgi:hypothetical protein
MNERRLLAVSAVLVGAIALSAPLFADRDVHLKVLVEDPATGETRMSMDIPLDSVDSVLEMLREHADIEIALGERARFRDMYLALRDEDLSDFLQINEDDKSIRVWKDDAAFQVLVTTEDSPDPIAKVYLPLELLDAVFLTSDDGSDLAEALDLVRGMAPLTLVEVHEEGETVRVWLE